MNLLFRYHTVTIQQPDHIATGSQVRQERRRRGLTLRDVATLAGISVPYLSNLEHGRRAWSAELLKRVEKALENLS